VKFLNVPGEQQVMLRVTVAEVNRSAARSIGMDFAFLNSSGDLVFGSTTAGLIPALAGGTSSTFSPDANLPTILDNGQVTLAIRALRNMSLARSLAEPNLVTMNGQRASFQAGGSFPVTTSLGNVTTVAETVQYVPFGVSVSFVPYITDRDRVRLVLQGQVSSRSENTVQAGNTDVPENLDQRTFQTTVELREGQTLAIAGLLQTNFGSDSNRVPLFGDLPILGNLAGRNNTAGKEQELVILVTPELVHPLEACQTPHVPGADTFEPGDVEFYLLGRLESRRTEDFRSAVRTDIARQCNYHHCRDIFIIGPQGHTYGCCSLPAAGCKCADEPSMPTDKTQTWDHPNVSNHD
jgi:pilus assembly protein CpaC